MPSTSALALKANASDIYTTAQLFTKNEISQNVRTKSLTVESSASLSHSDFMGVVNMNKQLIVKGNLASTSITNTGNLSTDSLTLHQTIIQSTGTEINYLVGVTANVQNQITKGDVTKGDVYDFMLLSYLDFSARA
jgi:hypothetical protein